MRAKLVRIGNSRGIRLPKAVIEEAGLGEEVELRVRKGEVVIARVKKVREGWAEDAKHQAKYERKIFWPEAMDAQPELPGHEWPEEDLK